MTDEPRPISLALQGGGSHGALALGAIDALLGDDGLRIDAISGTSAKAMNGAILAAGLARGGPDEARADLHRYWRAVARAGAMSPYRRSPWARWTGSWSLDDRPSYLWLDALTRLASPYQLNPLGLNPLRDVLDRTLNLEALNSDAAPRLYVTATDLRSGLPRIFRQPGITLDALMGSAALPHVFQAVESEGFAYWDGGYVANPALLPLLRLHPGSDIVLVQTNPFRREEVPRTGRDIVDRLNEITFNSALLKELRVIAHHQRLGASVRMHRIGADEELARFSPSAKMNVEWAYLTHLHGRGAELAESFLRMHRGTIGTASTFDPSAMLNDMIEPPLTATERTAA